MAKFLWVSIDNLSEGNWCGKFVLLILWAGTEAEGDMKVGRGVFNAALGYCYITLLKIVIELHSDLD